MARQENGEYKMNYKSAIAFLGTQQQKNWAKPVSNWIDCKKSADGNEWSEEFMTLANISSSKFRYMFQFYATVGDAGRSLTFATVGASEPNTRYRFWHNTDYGFTIILTYDIGEKQDEAIEKLKEHVDSQTKAVIQQYCKQRKTVRDIA